MKCLKCFYMLYVFHFCSMPAGGPREFPLSRLPGKARCCNTKWPAGGEALPELWSRQRAVSETITQVIKKGADQRSRYERRQGCIAVSPSGLSNSHLLSNLGSSCKSWWPKTENRPGRVQRPNLTATRVRSFRPTAKVTCGGQAGRAEPSTALFRTGCWVSATSSG